MFDTRRLNRTILALFSALLIAVGSATAQQDDEHGGHGGGTHEGAISITGDGSLDWMTVLGGSLGNQTVAGVDVGLFVLQADNPARLAPGAKGPTHVFNLTFLAADDGDDPDGVVGALHIEGPAATETLKVPFKPHQDYYQAATRLENEGDYRITVEFATDDGGGRTREFAFQYRRKKPTGAEDTSGHSDHSGHQH